MHSIVAIVSFDGTLYGVDIKVIDTETGEVVSSRAYHINKDEAFKCLTYYRASLVAEVVQEALDASLQVLNETHNAELAAMEFDYKTVYSPVINYPTSHISYA